MRNIGIDIRSLMTPAPTGVGIYTSELIKAILYLDTSNNYFLFFNSQADMTKYLPKFAANNVEYIAGHYPNKLFNASQKIFRSPKIDRLIVNQSQKKIDKLDFFFSPNLNFTSLTNKTKYLLTIHDISFFLYPQFFSRKQFLWHYAINPKKQCDRADLIITPSQNTKNDLVNHFKIPAEKIKVIYPGIQSDGPADENDKNIIKMKYNLPNKFILFLGTIEPRKNIKALIEAFEKIYPKLTEKHSLVIVGAPGWKNNQIYQRFQRSKYRDKIQFIGYIEEKEKKNLYQLASVFVYPSIYEGFGFPVLEAMANGLPVITSNRSSLPEISAPAALLINPNKPDEIGNYILEILNNQKLRDYLINKGKEQSSQFMWNKTAQKFLEIICA